LQKKNMTKIISALTFGVVLILLWQLVFFVGVDLLKLWKPYAFPSPLGVFKSLITLAEGWEIFLAVLHSLRRAVTGFLIAIVLGTILGLLITNIPYLKQNLKPFILGVQSLPSICWVPFAILWFGLRDTSILFVVVMGTMFSVAASVENAIMTIPALYVKAAKTMGASRKDLYRYVIFPAALPAIIAGLKQAWSFAWRALMSGEVMSASIGLGYSLMLGRDMADINQVMAVMIVIVVVGILIDNFVFSLWEKKVLKKRGML